MRELRLYLSGSTPRDGRSSLDEISPAVDDSNVYMYDLRLTLCSFQQTHLRPLVVFACVCWSIPRGAAIVVAVLSPNVVQVLN